MKQEIKITVPNDYSAITLEKFLEMQDDLKAYENEIEAVNAALFYHLCGLRPEVVAAMDTQSYQQIRNHLHSFINKTDWELQRFITIDGVEYGFEPNLSEISYGAYLDLGKLNTIEINKDWPKVMSILYRKVKRKVGKLYEIEGYTTKEETEHWLKVGMDVHFGALFFFINLSRDLLNSTLNSTMKTTGAQLKLKQTLQKSGEIILQSMNSLLETLPNTKK